MNDIPTHNRKQHALLVAIGDAWLTPGQLAERSSRDRHRVSESLRFMKMRGLVRRRAVDLDSGGRTYEYALTAQGRAALADPATLGQFRRNRAKPPRTASAVVRRLFEIVEARNLQAFKVAEAAGIHANSMTDWKHGVHAPGILALEAVAQVLGCRIVIEEGPDA